MQKHRGHIIASKKSGVIRRSSRAKEKESGMSQK
jgi:hypothetical protein